VQRHAAHARHGIADEPPQRFQAAIIRQVVHCTGAVVLYPGIFMAQTRDKGVHDYWIYATGS